MWYATNPTGKAKLAMAAQTLAAIVTPAQGNRIPVGSTYCADNGKFGKGWPGYVKWYRWLGKVADTYGVETCLFATAPDVPFDAYGTLATSLPWLGPIRQLGMPAAFCAQDGSENGLIPWRDIDVLFLAGSTEWKLGEGGRLAAAQAHAQGIPIHMGRVNSYKRYAYAKLLGCASVDGTFIVFGPDINLPKLLDWERRINDEPCLPWGA